MSEKCKGVCSGWADGYKEGVADLIIRINKSLIGNKEPSNFLDDVLFEIHSKDKLGIHADFITKVANEISNNPLRNKSGY